ncbi:MAG: ECF transporter S component [Spirochaetia bacterium]|jgi:uncharacterized membrane protein|nr:ECF transporter S component [Spirochaetia bacterium]
MSDKENKSSITNLPAFKIASLAILIAITTVFTFIIRIPIVQTKGYFNFSDVIIFFTAITFGPVTALIAGGIGTALADLLGGFVWWVPFTFLAHGLQGLAVGLILRKKISIPGILLAFAAATIIMAGIYFITAGIMYGFVLAAVEIPWNILQNLAGVIVGVPLAAAVKKAYPPIQNYKW